MSIEYFILPFEGKLDHNNRWVQLVNIIPWDKIEEKYSSLFPENKGNVAKPARLSLGALIISATARTVPVVALVRQLEPFPLSLIVVYCHNVSVNFIKDSLWTFSAGW